MDSLLVDGVTYWLPQNLSEVLSIVDDAQTNKEVICLRGAAHSFPIINLLEKGSSTGTKYKYVMLSHMFNVDIEGNTVKVDAGCHLGPDPWDPTGISKLENSLLYRLDQNNLSIPDLGGITHQTVGGFLSTASSGGSTQFSFEDALISIDIVTCEAGKGATVRTFNRPVPDNPDDPFYAAGVASRGLFGIIVSATFQCEPKFYIEGQEAITTVDTCAIDLFGPGNDSKPSLQTFLTQTQYNRLMWWPQENVHKMVVWQAKQTDEAGANAFAAQAYEKMGLPVKPLKPYEEVPYVQNSAMPATLGADILFSAIGRWPNWLLDLLGDTEEYKIIKGIVDVSFFPLILPKILDIFVAVDTPDNANKGPQQFSDLWYTGLPMDNQMSDKLMPVWFTELWIDINKTQEVMSGLQNFYNESTNNTGAFSCEIYAAKSNLFWLSPSYKQDVIRIDIFWFANNTGDPTEFYQRFWTFLAQYNYRPHWAKYLPDGASEQGVAYLKSNYPMWDNWMALRQQYDPNQVFVNDYWRQHLGIPTL
ncbi:MAG: D-arabinono-1,4-lactone oxidase [Ferruginibacter sp.]